MAAPSTTASKTNGNGKSSPEDIQAAYEALRRDVTELTRLVKEASVDRVRDARHRAEDAADEARRRAAEAAEAGQKAFEEQLRRGRDAVRDNPGGALAIAAGIGFLVGLMMTRRH